MSISNSSSQILDLLFDQNDGVLTSEYKNYGEKTPQQQQSIEENINDIKLFDLADLDVLSDDIFTTLLSGSILNCEEESALDKSVAKQVQADHDYFAQKSPGNNSDSGISIESVLDSPHGSYGDQSDVLMAEDVLSISSSPNLPDNYSTVGTNIVNCDMTEFGFEDLNLKDINVNFDGVGENSSASFLKQFDFQTTKDMADISIDFSDMPTSTSSTDCIAAVDVDTCRNSKTVQIHSYHSRSSSGDSLGLPFTMKDVSPDVTSTTSNQFPLLRLTDEEKDLLARENITLPTNMPLTKEEEKKLRTVRRKIRNKVSAKESRRRKVDYVDGLEQRVKLCTTENSQLQKKIENLEKQNVSMLAQLKKLQVLVTSKKTPAQTTTCIMVLLLSFALLVVPNFSPLSGPSSLSSDHPKSIVMPGKSRSLLQNTDAEYADNDPYGVSMKPSTPWMEQSPVTLGVKNAAKMEKAVIDVEVVMDVDMDSESNETDDALVIQNINMKNSISAGDVPSNENSVVKNNIVIDDKTVLNMKIPGSVMDSNSALKNAEKNNKMRN